MAKDVLLDDDYDLKILNGDFVIGESTMQDVVLILQTNKGEWKHDPILGCNLIELIKSKSSKVEVEKRVRLQLERDGKNYDKIKNIINFNI